MSDSKIISPLQRKSWHLLFLILSVAVIIFFGIHTIIMELARQAALRVDALMYGQNILNSDLSILIATTLLITWLVMVTIFFAVHPGHKSSPFDWLLVQSLFFGTLLVNLWFTRSQILLHFSYDPIPPETLIYYAPAVLLTYVAISSGIILLVVVYTLVTWFKVIKFNSESPNES